MTQAANPNPSPTPASGPDPAPTGDAARRTPASLLHPQPMPTPETARQQNKPSRFPWLISAIVSVIACIMVGILGVIFGHYVWSTDSGIDRHPELIVRMDDRRQDKPVLADQPKPVAPKVDDKPILVEQPKMATTEPQLAVAGTFVGAGRESEKVSAFHVEQLEVIVKDAGSQTVDIVCSPEHLPINVKPNQPAPPNVAGLNPGDTMVPCLINIRPETPSIFKPVWAVQRATAATPKSAGL